MSLVVDGRAALGDLELEVELRVEPGETLAVLGPNGAGKSTLLRVLAGLHPLEDGQVRLDGQILDEPATGGWVPPERRSIGLVFQDLLLFEHLDVVDNIAFGLSARGQRRSEARIVARSWAERLGLGSRIHARPRQLSGGEAQRVALARALVREPELLLLDEPFGALDALTRIRMHGLLQDLCRRHTPAVLLVTHDVDEAILLADRVVVLTAGAISLDVEVEVPKPRRRESAEFAALRRWLLTELGVIDGLQI
jgi:sulfonate transport system ATP-binding protein